MSVQCNGIQIPSMVDITFTEQWSTVCSTQIPPGCTVVIRYAKDRLLSPDDSVQPSDAKYYVEMKFHENATKPVSKLLSANTDNPSYVSATVKIPVYCREVVMWFKIVKDNGECDYDSNGGVNYAFGVCGNAVMLFQYGAEVQTKGFVTPGGTIRIIYDSRKLPGRDFYCGQPAWDIQATMIEDCGRETRKVMQAMDENVDPILKCDFDIPLNVNFVSFWFKHWGHFGGDSFDTNGGRNYRVSFESDGEIWFTEHMEAIQKGVLLNGRKVSVWFDTNRIFKETPHIKNGVCVHEQKSPKIKWLKVHAQFDNVVVDREFSEVHKDNCLKCILDIPVKANGFVLWFTYGDFSHKEILFDSNYGQNYRFELLC